MNPIIPRLRPIHYKGHAPRRVELIVPGGADLEVPDELAEQLLAHGPQFVETTVPADAITDDDGTVDDAPAKTRRRKGLT